MSAAAAAVRKAASALVECADALAGEDARLDARLAARLALARERPREPLGSAGEMLLRACAVMGVDIEEARGPRKTRELARQRRVLTGTMRLAGWSYPEIGDAMHRDHTSILWADRRRSPAEERVSRALAARLGVGPWRPPTFVLVPARLAPGRWGRAALAELEAA